MSTVWILQPSMNRDSSKGPDTGHQDCRSSFQSSTSFESNFHPTLIQGLQDCFSAIHIHKSLLSRIVKIDDSCPDLRAGIRQVHRPQVWMGRQ